MSAPVSYTHLFHYEAVASIKECVALCRTIRSLGAKAGVSVRPKTPIDEILPYLHEMDVFLIMSVEPGFGGQSFMEDQLDKVRKLRSYIDAVSYTHLPHCLVL